MITKPLPQLQNVQLGGQKLCQNISSPEKPPPKIVGDIPDEIKIHVFDENRKIDKEFTCERHLITQYMKYFEKYLSDGNASSEIDISVHCDIKIFEWLMKYLRHTEKLKK